ncbi:hypothetical protein [Lachnoanaerobaculum orale]|uniref:hypothetical protein n=1 Tax=Lachnoanaerobaculum orale TaxID=979627 RepID=UPI0023A87819|nr:hypothetical protein [Lachnoanaerobaculum orale]
MVSMETNEGRRFFVNLNIGKGELAETLSELYEAAETIRKCYMKLGALGLVFNEEVSKEDTSIKD